MTDLPKQATKQTHSPIRPVAMFCNLIPALQMTVDREGDRLPGLDRVSAFTALQYNKSTESLPLQSACGAQGSCHFERPFAVCKMNRP